MIYEQMLSEHQRLEEEIQAIDVSLQKLPQNKFYVAGNNEYDKWYIVENSKRHYLPKSQRKLAEKLATAKYLSLRKEDLIQEKDAIESYLKKHNSRPAKADELITPTSAYAELLNPYFQPPSPELLDWINFPYQKNTRNPENLCVETLSGNFVRSKSEAIIDMRLHLHKIPYRYECILSFPDWTCYPDFTIRHPKTGETFYWEHLGLMDDPKYSQKAYKKIQAYINHKIIPNKNLILTFETAACPLSTMLVEQIINQYFL